MFGPPAAATLFDLASDPVLMLRADLSALRASAIRSVSAASPLERRGPRARSPITERS